MCEYSATGRVAGEEGSSTYEGRHLSIMESELVHPSHTDGFVNKGDPVLHGENIVGVAFKDAAAATDIVAIDTEGIWYLMAQASDESGGSAIATGDEIYINKTTAVLSKRRNQGTHSRFGYALGPVGSGLTALVAIKVHWDPDVYENDVIVAKTVTFTETTGAGVYTGSISVPAGSFLVDIAVHATALWDTTTSATMKVGDATTDNGYFTAVNLKATDLLAGESINFTQTGGKEGADLDSPAAGSHVRRRYLAAARVISGIVTTVGAAGSAGRTRMTVYYSTPTTIVAATKV